MHKRGYLLSIIDGSGSPIHSKQLFVFQETAVIGIQFLGFFQMSQEETWHVSSQLHQLLPRINKILENHTWICISNEDYSLPSRCFSL